MQEGGDEHGAKTPKRRRGERDGRRTSKRHRGKHRLYLVFDDWPWGYTIREIDLSSTDVERRQRRLPRPFIKLEAPRGRPWLFAAVGTKIVATHSRDDPGLGDSMPGVFLPIVDVRSRAVHFGPGLVHLHLPIFFPVGDDELYALDTGGFKMLSLKPLWPPRLERDNNHCHYGKEWTWHCLPEPPFDRMDVASYALHPDGRTVLVSTAAPEFIANPFNVTDDGDDDGGATAATFAFDTKGNDNNAWARHGEWTMPFVGRAHFVHGLNAFVGLSDDLDTPGHLCSCEGAVVTGGGRPSWKLGKEKMFGEGPNERHVGATLLYMGGGSGADERLCLVQCVSIDDGDADEDQLEEEEGVVSRPTAGYRYRLTTFSLSYDTNGDLTSGETCRLQWYRVPREITQASSASEPVAFWL